MTFPEVTLEKWRAQVEKELAGAPFDKVLVQKSIEGLAIAPLHVEGPAAPLGRETRGEPFRFALRADGEAGLEGIVADLTAGAEAIWLTAGPDLEAVVAHVESLGGTVIVEPGNEAPLAVAGRLAAKAPSLAFVLAADPLSRRARGEIDDAGLQTALADLADVVKHLDEAAKQASALVVSTLVFHEAGADAADEIGLALAAAATYLEALLAGGVSLETAARTLTLQLSVGRDTFLELCKLRALRLCWSKLLLASGPGDPPAARVHAVCSRRTLSVRDPWVNMLRTTTQMFAAILGGAALITPTAFDEVNGAPGELGRRVARNTGLVLREESQLGWVVDPAGGSYFFETLTDALAREAWTRFQGFARDGGLPALLADGRLAARLAATWQTRLDALAKRRTPVLGVSEFANLDEKLPRPAAADPAASTSPLPAHRDAEAFEALRLAADEQKPEAVLVTLGPLAESRPRVGFAAGFFGAGGIRVRESVEIEGAPLVCLCGSDERYASEAVDKVRALRAAGAGRVLLAGRPGALEAPLREAGLDGSLFVGCDVLAALQDLLGKDS